MHDLQFLVMLDLQLSRSEVLDVVLASFPDAVYRKANSCDLRGNWLEVWANEDADSRLASDEDDGFLYYRWRVEATPSRKGLREDEQIEFAWELRSKFEEWGGRAIVCAAFEGRI